MDEERPAVTEIPPLRWPEGIKLGPRGKRLTLVRSKEKWRILEGFEKQVAARPPIPPEVWGPDPRRHEMATIICGLIEDEMFWVSSQFIPEDPANIIFVSDSRVNGGDGEYWFLDNLEKRVLLRDCADKGQEQLELKTFGEIVDYCLIRADYWPIPAWSPDPTGNICPTFTAFYDIRRFVCSRYSLDRKAVSPSTRLAMCKFGWGSKLCGDKWQYLNNYLSKRFGKDEVLSDRFLGVFPFGWSWLALSLGFSGFLARRPDTPGIGWWILLIPLVGLVALLVTCFLSWPRWRKGLRTFRDLVEYVAGGSRSSTPTT